MAGPQAPGVAGPLTAIVTRHLSGWEGPDWKHATFIYERCLELGMSRLRAEIAAHIASHKKYCWTFADKLASLVKGRSKDGTSSRSTVQRTAKDLRRFGLMMSRRGERGEQPPNGKGKLRCGFALRWFIGRDEIGPNMLAGTPYWAAVAKQRARYMTKVVSNAVAAPMLKVRDLVAQSATKHVPRQPPPGVDKVEWIEREMEADRARAASKARDGP